MKLCLPIRVVTRVRNSRLPDSGLNEGTRCTELEVIIALLNGMPLKCVAL